MVKRICVDQFADVKLGTLSEKDNFGLGSASPFHFLVQDKAKET